MFQKNFINSKSNITSNNNINRIYDYTQLRIKRNKKRKKKLKRFVCNVKKVRVKFQKKYYVSKQTRPFGVNLKTSVERLKIGDYRYLNELTDEQKSKIPNFLCFLLKSTRCFRSH